MIGYATTEELIQYAAARGVTLSQAPEVLLTLALDYIESLEPLLDGERVDPEQPYSWPRTLTAGVPLAIKQSQMIAAMTADSGVVLMPVTSGAQIIREKVGPLETEYAEGAPVAVSIQQVEGLISAFLKGAGFFPMNLVRV